MFQFLIVRLKFAVILCDLAFGLVSIPYSTIKILNPYVMMSGGSAFQFLIVRLKFEVWIQLKKS